MEDLNLDEGTIEFWVRKGKLKWNDGASHILLNIPKLEGSIFMIKDADNKLKFFHVIMGKGRTDVETDVSELDNAKDHYVAVTWSVKTKQIRLFIDGEVIAESTIKYD